MKDPSSIDISVLTGETDYAYETNSIDNPSNLHGQKVWLFSGTADSVVAQGIYVKSSS